MIYQNITEAKRLAPPLPAIYAIAHPPAIYIGATNNFKRRMIEHSYQLKARPKKQANLSAMLSKYGVDNCQVFTLLVDENKSLDKATLNEYEAGIMTLFGNLGYNVVSSANLLNTGQKNNFYGKTHTKEVKEKASRRVRVQNEITGVGIEFDSVEIAARSCNVSPAYIIKKCKQGVKNGIEWRYSTAKIIAAPPLAEAVHHPNKKEVKEASKMYKIPMLSHPSLSTALAS